MVPLAEAGESRGIRKGGVTRSRRFGCGREGTGKRKGDSGARTAAALLLFYLSLRNAPRASAGRLFHPQLEEAAEERRDLLVVAWQRRR